MCHGNTRRPSARCPAGSLSNGRPPRNPRQISRRYGEISTLLQRLGAISPPKAIVRFRTAPGKSRKTNAVRGADAWPVLQGRGENWRYPNLIARYSAIHHLLGSNGRNSSHHRQVADWVEPPWAIFGKIPDVRGPPCHLAGDAASARVGGTSPGRGGFGKSEI